MILFRQEFRPFHLVDLLRRELEPILPGVAESVLQVVSFYLKEPAWQAFWVDAIVGILKEGLVHLLALSKSRLRHSKGYHPDHY